ncbi:MAG: hypothetical protein U1E65_23635 [Myxococcota bacterium]
MRKALSFLVLASTSCASMKAWEQPLPGRPGRPGNTLDGVYVPIQTSPEGTWAVAVTDEDGNWGWASKEIETPATRAEISGTAGADLFVTTSTAGMEVRGIGALSGEQLFVLALPEAEYGRVGAVISQHEETRVIGAGLDGRSILIAHFDASTGHARSIDRISVYSASKIIAAVGSDDQRLTIAYASSHEAPLRLLQLDEGRVRFDVPVPYSESSPTHTLRVLDLQHRGTGTTLVGQSSQSDLGFWEWNSEGAFRGLNFRATSGWSVNAAGLNDLDILLVARPGGGRMIEYRSGAYWNQLGSVALPDAVCRVDCQVGVTRHGGVILAGADPAGGYRAWAIPPPEAIARALDLATGWALIKPKLRPTFFAPWRQNMIAHASESRNNPRRPHLH